MNGRMRKVVLISLMLFTSVILKAQFVIDWQQCYGGENNDKASGILQVDDGFLIVGASESPNSGMVDCDFGNYDNGAWLIKIDDDANLLWGNCSRYGCMAFDRKLPGRYIYLLGPTNFSSTGKTGLGITRMDENGNTIWGRVVGNEDRDFWYCMGGIATSDGGVAGFATPCFSGGDISHAYGNIDGWVIKLDSLGNTEWDVTLGTDEADFVYGLCETSDEGFFAFMKSTAGALPGSIKPCNPVTNWHDAVLVKLSKNGEIEWNRCYGGKDSDQFNIGIEINDGYLMVGTSSSDDGDLEGAGYHLGYVNMQMQQKSPDIWLLRLDYDGNVVWSRCYGGSGIDIPIRVFQNEDGGFTVFANSASLNGDVQSAAHWGISQGHELNNYWVFRTDSEGNLLWERAIGSRNGAREELNAVVKHNDREYTLAGFAPNWSSFMYDLYHGDITCSNNYLCGEPGSAVYWIVHIRDVFDYDAVDENVCDKQEPFNVFPIPAKDVITVRGSEDTFHYSIFNAIGQKVAQGSAQGEQQINVASISKGIYFIRFTNGTQTCVKKIVLE